MLLLRAVACMLLLRAVACMLLLALLACCCVPVPVARMLCSCAALRACGMLSSRGARCVPATRRNNNCNNKEHHEHIYCNNKEQQLQH
jgi:hypothetical protein